MIFAFYGVIVIHVIACLFLIGVVLLQQGKNQDLASAFGGGGTQTAFGPRGSANVLSRATTVLAAVFMITCLALSFLRTRPTGILDRVSAPSPPASSKPAVPPANSAAAPASSAAPAANPPAPANPAAAPANPAAAPAGKPTAPPSK